MSSKTKEVIKPKIKPIEDRIVVLCDAPTTMTAGGLYIPDEAKEQKTQRGRVIAVGPDVEYINEGEVVIFGKYAGTDILVDNISYLILKLDEVLCVVE